MTNVNIFWTGAILSLIHIFEETPDVIINVADSSNLERNFYLTTQLIYMNVRMVIALNMYCLLYTSRCV